MEGSVHCVDDTFCDISLFFSLLFSSRRCDCSLCFLPLILSGFTRGASWQGKEEGGEQDDNDADGDVDPGQREY
jgi:hypothetical protein